MDGVSPKRVQVLYFEGCPNHRPTVALAQEVIAELGVDATVEEVEVQSAEDVERLRFLGSPSVHIDGVDIEPAARACTQYAFACRTYGGAGVPPRELLTAALTGRDSSNTVRPSAPGRGWRRSLPTAAGAVALLLPVGTCPACFPAYAAVLSSLGLGFLLYERYVLPIAATLLVTALVSLTYRARTRRGYAPFLVGLVGSAAALVGKFSLTSDLLLYAGLSALVAAAAWNAWPKQDAPPSCVNCAR